MIASATALLDKYHQQKRLVHWNHDIHFLHRDKTWIEQGIDQIINGSYSPWCIERLYFADGPCDSIPMRDRVLLRIIYDELKPTFKQVINPHCYHLQGPNGVREASAKIRTVFKEKKPTYFIRADIKSYFASIDHDVLIDDIKAHYADKQLIQLLTQVIKTPIKTQDGYINPNKGIALRSPLSGFFSGLYLKELDDCFTSCQVDYFRFQDDLLILCPSLRSLKRCKARLIQLLARKRLSLSVKKTKIGPIEQGFHFLGIDYLGTQTLNNTNSLGVKEQSASMHLRTIFHSSEDEQEEALMHTPCLLTLPHSRTVRRAREQVRSMVAAGVSHQKIRTYLCLWASWWHTAAPTWKKAQLLEAFLALCWDKRLVHYVQGVLYYSGQDSFTLSLQPHRWSEL